MKVGFIASASSTHTASWVNRLSDSGLDVFLISQHPVTQPISNAVEVYEVPNRGNVGYFTMARSVKRILRHIQPDLVNAHYASGYGTTARLVGFRPTVLSVWGSDVYEFPNKSILHRRLVVGNLHYADKLVSTSHCMARQTSSLSSKINDIDVVPFGVDLKDFNPDKIASERIANDCLVIGTVKSMKHVYGIDILLEAFAKLQVILDETSLRDSLPSLRLHIVGGGELMADYIKLSNRLKIGHLVKFSGANPHSAVPKLLSNFDIFVALSREESFGVSIIEASAMGLPVVVSDAEGFMETAVDGVTGLVVPRNDPAAAAESMFRLLQDPGLRARLGAAGRAHVAANYSWPICIEKMSAIYRNMSS